MKTSGNTILITGGGSGIGRGLALALHKLGNNVIVAGRRRSAVAETAASASGIIPAVLDVDNPDAIRAFAANMIAEYPRLNVLINNAGIMRVEDLKTMPAGLAAAEASITTNLLGPIRLTALFLPHLLKQSAAAIINITSGLAFVPLPITPTYCATKAAIHSYTVSLRTQLAGTPVEVIEIIPPAVVTDLTPGRSDADQRLMPLQAYIDETMQFLQATPTPLEICSERAKFLRTAEASGNFDKALQQLSAVRFQHT